MKLLLFDIDGTLIHTGGAGIRSLNRAFEKLYGCPDVMAGISLAGRTDDLIVREAFGRAGLDFSDKDLPRFKSIYFQFIAEEIYANGYVKRLMPGIAELIPELDRHPDICLALLTGNWQRSARIKMDYFELNPFFAFGAFSDDSPERSELVPVAIQRFRNRYGSDIRPHDVYVIGDTPADVLCAKPHGVVSVAVAAAAHPFDELAQYEPDILLHDLSDKNSVLELFT
ncbi:HAD family hydrolase [candidate division KSB1 bacterium]|nr:HAD hydrolase-like protein [candidate division KSB1 bacterium]RQW06128.1 MAG: HAD family hydrolase [candidate division KSB1 bacterium]